MQRPGDEKALAELDCDRICCGKKLAGKQVLSVVLRSYRFVLSRGESFKFFERRGWLGKEKTEVG